MFSTTVIATEPFSIASCGIFNQSNTIYYLENDVYTTETCLVISANNISLDCQGHNITGSEAEDTYGIYVKGNYSKIKNCSISKFYMGLYLYQSSNNILTNINSYNNNDDGIGLSGSNNTLSNINSYNNYYGFYLYGSNNILSNINSYNNYYGINLYGSNNILTNINSYNNEHNGIYLYFYSSNNILTNINSYSNRDKYAPAYDRVGGLYLYHSNNNILTNITSYNNSRYGISLYDSYNNTITNINSYDNQYGLSLSTGNNIMRNVSLWNNKYNSEYLGHHNDIDKSNTVNSKPIYYLKNVRNQIFDDSTNVGVFYCLSCDNITIKDLNFTHNHHGIYLWNTTNSRIVNINSYNNNGFYLYGSNNILSNINSYNGDGLSLSNSDNNILSNINSYNNNGDGLSLSNSDNNILSNINSYNNNDDGIGLSGSNNILTNINSYNNNWHGIGLSGSNNSLSNVNSHANGHNTGWPYYSYRGHGLYFDESNNNILLNISSYNNGDGLSLDDSNNNIFTNITFYNNSQYGLYLYGSNNTLLKVNSYNNDYGLYLSSRSYNNILKNNTISNNKYNFNLYMTQYYYGYYSEYYDNDIDKSNTVNGKPIYYLKNVRNQIFDDSTNVGVFYCFSCDNITVKDLNFTKNGVGIFFWNTSNSKIENINSYNNVYGLFFYNASNNALNNINSYNNAYGLYLSNSNNNAFTDINSYNNQNGINIDESNNNTLSNINSYNNKWLGFSLYKSNNNILTNINSYNHLDYCGFCFQGSGSNTLSNINSYNNTYGLRFYPDSPYNKIKYSNIYSNTYNNLYNDQPHDVNAEYNYWGYTTAEEIDATIYDDNENPSLGEVDFTPWLNNPGSNFEEKYRSETNLNETVLYQNAGLNATISGDMEGTINFSNFNIVKITTGAFANKGFSKGHWQASLDNHSYEGGWQGFLLHDTTERKIYLKGSISSYFKGTVEGYLEESVNGSNIYDKYYAIWKIVKDDSSAILELSGTLTYKESSEFQTMLHMLQTSVRGQIVGDYDNNLDIILTYLRINEENPFYGEGFSIISYTSDTGSGQGWVYASYSSLLKITELSGMFTSPLYGVARGILDESKSPLRLVIGVDRVDLGLPPMADLEVKVWGPTRVSPGQTVDYIIGYRNDGLKEAEDVVVVFRLSNLTEYISSSNGVYMWETHEVLWKLGTLLPRSKGHLSVRVRVILGLSQGTKLKNIVRIGTTSDEIDTYLTGLSPIYDISKYLTYQPIEVVSNELLSPEELEIELEDTNFSDIHIYAKELGYDYTNITGKIILSDNSKIVYLVMNNSENISLVAKFKMIDYPNLSLIIKADENYVTFFNREGGIKYDIETGEVTSYGNSWLSNTICCIGNCMTGIIPGVGELQTLNDCRIFLQNGDIEGFWGCVKGITSKFWKVVIPVTCISECLIDYSLHICQHCTWREFCQSWPNKVMSQHCDDCQWSLDSLTHDPEIGGTHYYIKDICDPDEICIGPSIEDKPKAGSTAECKKKDEVPNSDSSDSVIQVAIDPNIKYGPEGYVLPSQTLNYTVEYENEGEGIAFGVYFTDTLDENLDDSTLEIGPVISTLNGSVISPPGIYNPATRTITWFVGEVGPKEGGYANFNVSVKSNPTIGTEIINFATVYFPSVPEETRTNGIISIVRFFANFSLSLTKGWNLIAIPFNISNKTAEWLCNEVNCSLIFAFYDQTWRYYTPTNPDSENTLKTIDETMGLWIKVNKSLELGLEGSLFENAEINLTQGWNLIGHQSLIEMNINESYLKNYTIFSFTDNSWLSYIPDRTFNSLQTLKPGYGYWVKKI